MRDNSSHDRPPARFITAPELGGGMSAEGLDAIFSPRSIAVIGASRHRGKIGYEILRNLIVNEYQGILYPVNPNATGIHGIRAYPRISDVPDPVDLAVITVPADLAVDAAKACGEKGVRGLVVITAGFREIGGVGVERESRLLRICESYGLTLVGPNCMGVINTHPDVRMDATFAPTPPLRGGISLVTQTGVLRAGSIEELFDLAMAFSLQPLPRGDRVAIVSDAGGPAIMCVDELIAQGLRLAELSPATQAFMHSWAPAEASLRNPVDLTPQGTLEDYRRALEAVLADSGVDAAIAIYVPPVRVDEVDVARAVWQAAEAHAKPVLCNFLGRSEDSPGFVELVSHGVPSYLFPESAARSLAAMYRHGQYRKRDEGTERTFTVDRDGAAAILARAAQEGRSRLLHDEANAVLAAYGIQTAKARLVRRLEDVSRAAKGVGFPVVLKAAGPEIVHKTELQAVALGLQDEKELLDAASRMERRLRQRKVVLDGFLVQEFVEGGKEVILGMTRDRVYGPLLVFGLGGIYVEYLKDVSFGLPPLTDRDAIRMIESIRTYPLLRGVRGEPARDVPALQEAILRLAALVSDHDSIQEMDLNPVIALEQGRGYRVVDARIVLTAPSREPEPKELRF